MPLGEQTAARVRTDEELIGAFQNGDQRAYDLLVGRYKDQLVNFAFRFLGEYDGADQVAQGTLIRGYRKKHSYKPIAKFSTWIYTIAANLAKSELRRRTRHGLFSLSGRRRGGGGREVEPAGRRDTLDGRAGGGVRTGGPPESHRRTGGEKPAVGAHPGCS